MPISAPRIIPPVLPVYTLTIDNSEPYSDLTYQRADEAQAACEALQSAYERYGWPCRFSVRACEERTLVAFDTRLISMVER